MPVVEVKRNRRHLHTEDVIGRVVLLQRTVAPIRRDKRAGDHEARRRQAGDAALVMTRRGIRPVVVRLRGHCRGGRVRTLCSPPAPLGAEITSTIRRTCDVPNLSNAPRTSVRRRPHWSRKEYTAVHLRG